MRMALRKQVSLLINSQGGFKTPFFLKFIIIYCIIPLSQRITSSSNKESLKPETENSPYFRLYPFSSFRFIHLDFKELRSCRSTGLFDLNLHSATNAFFPSLSRATISISILFLFQYLPTFLGTNPIYLLIPNTLLLHNSSKTNDTWCSLKCSFHDSIAPSDSPIIKDDWNGYTNLNQNDV